MVTVLPTGEAYTSELCPICRQHHRVMSDDSAERFKRLGMTDAEIAAITAWTEREYRDLHAVAAAASEASRPEMEVEKKSRPPSHSPERTKARVDAWRARQKAKGQ